MHESNAGKVLYVEVLRVMNGSHSGFLSLGGGKKKKRKYTRSKAQTYSLGEDAS